MSVASLDKVEENGNKYWSGGAAVNEALMILGVQGATGREAESELRREKGILDVSVVQL